MVQLPPGPVHARHEHRRTLDKRERDVGIPLQKSHADVEAETAQLREILQVSRLSPSAISGAPAEACTSSHPNHSRELHVWPVCASHTASNCECNGTTEPGSCGCRANAVTNEPKKPRVLSTDSSIPRNRNTTQVQCGPETLDRSQESGSRYKI